MFHIHSDSKDICDRRYSADFFDGHHHVVVRPFLDVISYILIARPCTARGFVRYSTASRATKVIPQLVPTQLSIRVDRWASCL
jgi:hypothetical protein